MKKYPKEKGALSTESSSKRYVLNVLYSNGIKRTTEHSSYEDAVWDVKMDGDHVVHYSVVLKE